MGPPKWLMTAAGHYLSEGRNFGAQSSENKNAGPVSTFDVDCNGNAEASVARHYSRRYGCAPESLVARGAHYVVINASLGHVRFHDTRAHAK